MVVSLLLNILLATRIITQWSGRSIYNGRPDLEGMLHEGYEQDYISYVGEYMDSRGKDPLDGLRAEDLEFIDRVVDLFDRYVLSSVTGTALTVPEAYRAMFDEYRFEEGQVFPGLGWEQTEGLTYDIILGRLRTGFLHPVYSCMEDNLAGWNFWYRPLFYAFMEKAGRENPFWFDCADSYASGGAPAPTNTASVINSPGLVNFSQRAQRFLVAMMFIEDGTFAADYIIRKDLQHNIDFLEEARWYSGEYN